MDVDLNAVIKGTAVEKVEAEDAGTTAAPARSGVISLVRIAGRPRLARAPGEISLRRIALRATLASFRCHHHQEGTTTTTKTRGLGASRSPELSPASSVALRH